MRKTVLALFLLALLVGVSFVKQMRQDDKATDAQLSTRQELSFELSEKDGLIDSLTYLAGQQQVDWADSLMKKDAVYRRQVDSLENALGKKNDAMGTMEAKVRELENAKKQSLAKSKTSAAASKSRHERILALYKEKHKALPTDLSAYERRVALAEIREETAEKFSISLADLDRIRVKYKLKY